MGLDQKAVSMAGDMAAKCLLGWTLPTSRSTSGSATKACSISASRAVTKNSAMGLNAAKPVVVTVSATRPNTPRGANFITHIVSSVMMSG